MAKRQRSRTVTISEEAYDNLMLVFDILGRINTQKSTIVLKRGRRTTALLKALRRRMKAKAPSDSRGAAAIR